MSEEIRDRDKLIDPAVTVGDIVDLLKDIAETTLRQELEMLTKSYEGRDYDWKRDVFTALLAATQAGYDCGVRMQCGGATYAGLFAVLRLPTGTVTFELDDHWYSVDEEDISETPARIAAFLNGEVTPDGGTAPQ